MTKKQSVLVFGGAFNPPTLAHEAIIMQCLSLPQFSEVWLMPSGDRDDKFINTPAEHRLNMLEIIKATTFKNSPRLVISDFELKLNGTTKTYKTVSILAIKHPDINFWFAFGNDSYSDMTRWDKGYQLKTRLHMVLFGDAPPNDFNNKKDLFIQVPAEFSHMSASKARSALQQGTTAPGLVNPAVAQYALDRSLYK